uniref:Annexin n=1 Tax=Cricetulus griseus TaxID=10029 RepID=A0A8C2MWN6_CRIGR
MSYQGYRPTGYTPFPGYPPVGQESSFPPTGGAYPPAPSGSYPGAGGYATPGGCPAPGGYPITPSPGDASDYLGGQEGFSGYPQPPAQSYCGGPAQVPVPGGFPGGQMPFKYLGGQAPYPSQPAAMTQGTQGRVQLWFGADEQAIAGVMSSSSNDQRQQIKAVLKTMYGKDLIKLSGNMEELILALFMPSTYYDGAGPQECIQDIVRCYQSEFGQDLEKDIKSDTSGCFECLLVSMCQGNFDKNQSVNHPMVQDDAQHLYQAAEGKLGTDESCFNMILATRRFPQLKATMEVYSRMANRDLLSSFTRYIECGLKTILQCAGTDDSTLVRTVVTQSEIDLVQIKTMFTQMHQKNLRTMIASDRSGDFRKLLLAIVGQREGSLFGFL